MVYLGLVEDYLGIEEMEKKMETVEVSGSFSGLGLTDQGLGLKF